MRFGAFVPQGWRLDLVGIDQSQQWPTISSIAHAVEAGGYDSVWVYDHFHTVPVATQEVTFEAWTLMAALASTTENVRLGQMCTCNSYRSPAYLAKVAASIDVISGGRLEMGIGAGWYEEEYLAYGYEFPKPSVRIGQLDEAVEIMKRMWTEEEVHFDGEHYRLEGAICQPKPLQKPYIPLWVAGGGEQLTLNVAARHASYTNFGNGDLETFQHKSEVLRRHCEEEGSDFESITRSTNLNLVCEETESDVEERLRWIEDHYRRFAPDQAERVARQYRAMAGTPEQLIERLRPLQAAGLGYAIVYIPGLAYDSSGLQRFAEQVIPAFR